MRAALAVLAVAACGGARAAPENRAYLVRPTPESRQAIARAVEQALATGRVDIDDDALTRDGALVIERRQLGDPGPLVSGRDPGDPGLPERFHLVKIGEHCVLVHDRTDQRYDLLGATCEQR